MATLSMRRFRSAFLCAWMFAAVSLGLAQQKPATLHLEIGPITLLRMPSWVALSEGIYQKNNLQVEMCHTRIVIDEMKAMGIDPPMQYACASATVAPSTTDPNISGRPSDPITLNGGFPNFIRQVISPTKAARRVTILSTSNVTGWPIYVRKGITSGLELKGKSMAVLSFTDIHGFMAMTFTEAMGWDPRTDLKLVEEWGPPAVKLLESGKIDSMVATDSAQWLLQKDGYTPLVDLRNWKVPMTSASVNVDSEWLKNNRETAAKLVKSLVDARALMEKDPSTFNRALAKYFNITDPKMQAFLYAGMDTLPRKPYPAIDGLRKAVKMYEDFYPELKRVRVEEFVDDSFVRELDQTGYIDQLYK